MEITLGFSPCPNDTFIFDALVNGKIDTEGIEFKVFLEDVQTLNEWALEGKLDCSKISYGVLHKILNQYQLLRSGGALGNGVGPLLIQSENINLSASEINDLEVAIPGLNTTAHALFSKAYPNAKKKVFLRYDEIEDFVLSGKGLGVIIHENRFTYEAKGLYKIIDLGDYWEEQTGFPIPLGGIVLKRSLHKVVCLKIERLIAESVEYAFKHYQNSLPEYITANAQEMSEAVMRQHIDLYVNDFSFSLGDRGTAAVIHLLKQQGFEIPYNEALLV